MYLTAIYTETPTYRYVLVTNHEEKVQYDWKLFHRPEVELTAISKELKLTSDMIGRKAKDVIKEHQYFIKPR